MKDLASEICFKIKEARRAAKLSQGVVANEVGCRQSALSMFEQGDGTKLNDAVIDRLAKKFGVDLKKTAAEENKGVTFVPSVTTPVVGFCPNPRCPTNRAYEVEGRAFLKPDRSAADPVGGRFCAFCGEVLQKACPNCGAPVHDGAVCSHCGEPYIEVAGT